MGSKGRVVVGMALVAALIALWWFLRSSDAPRGGDGVPQDSAAAAVAPPSARREAPAGDRLRASAAAESASREGDAAAVADPKVAAAAAAPASGAPASVARPSEQRAPQVPLGDRPAWVEVPGASGLKVAAVLVRAPLGLASDATARPGIIEISANGDFTGDLRFRVSASPADGIEIGSPIVVVSRARSNAQVRLRALREGVTVVGFTLLGPADAPTSVVLHQSIEATSFRNVAEPQIAGGLGPVNEYGAGQVRGGSMEVLAALRGTSPGTLKVARTDFRDFATAATEIAITAEDPAGILADWPRTAVIAPGQRFANAGPVRVREVAGRAVLVLRAGSAEARVRVESVVPRWTPPPRAIVPLGTEALVSVAADPPSFRLDGAVVESSALGCALVRVVPGSPDDMFPESLVVGVRGLALGTASVAGGAEARPGLAFEVEVVPADVAVGRQELTISGLSAESAGTFTFELPKGLRWGAGAAAEPGGAKLTGLGTPRLEVSLAPAASRAETLVVSAPIEGSASGDVVVTVRDDVHRPLRARYTVIVR